jgi:hypothetical protein
MVVMILFFFFKSQVKTCSIKIGYANFSLNLKVVLSVKLAEKVDFMLGVSYFYAKNFPI